MGQQRCVWLVVFVLLGLLGGLPAWVKEADANWQRFDVSKDKRFDQADTITFSTRNACIAKGVLS